MGLPLLRLPNLVITNIVDITEIDDLVCLSLCSKRARNILMVCRRQIRLKGYFVSATVVYDFISVNIPYSGIEVIQISNLENYIEKGFNNDYQLFSNRTLTSVTEEIKEMETVEIGGHRVPFYRGNGALITFWEDERIGLRKCMDFARETFRMPVKLLKFSKEGMWAFDWVNGWEEKIHKMTVQAAGIQDDELKYIMENCEARMLETNGYIWTLGSDYDYYPSESFQLDLHVLKTKCFLSYSPAPWITVQNIATSFLEALIINESSMTNRDVNLFLRLWLAGGFPCLIYISIELCENISDDLYANGVKNELRKTSYQHKFRRNDHNGPLDAQYDLQQRGNGRKKASIRFSKPSKKRVCLSVWG